MRGLLVLVFAVMVCVASAVRADEEPAGYRATIEQALAEYQLRNYEEASTLFGRANALFPNARTLRGLGMAAFELRRYDESATHLEASLASEVRPLEGELRQDTEALLARARGFLAVVKVVLDPSHASLLLDGQTVASRELNLRVGEHTLEARAPDYESQRRTVRVHGGEQLKLDIALQRELVGAPVERPKQLYKSAWLWTGVGLVVAGGVVAGVLLATRDGGTRTVANETPNSVPGLSLSGLGVR